MKRIIVTLLVSLPLLAGVAAGIALATPSSRVSSAALVQGTFGDGLDVKVKTGDWKLKIDAQGATDIAVTENRVAPGDHFGWHSHPGASLVVVKSGTSTFYYGDDPACTPHVYEQGMAYVDPGGRVHIARNEGIVDLVLVVTRLSPSGVPARIDEPDPGNCGS